MPEHQFPILLKHDTLGSTHVYTAVELDERLKKGWSEPQVAALLKAPEPQGKRKPGRPRKA